MGKGRKVGKVRLCYSDHVYPTCVCGTKATVGLLVNGHQGFVVCLYWFYVLTFVKV